MIGLWIMIIMLKTNNTTILQIGRNTFADNWKFNPLTFYALFNSLTSTMPFHWTQHWKDIDFCPQHMAWKYMKITLLSGYDHSREWLLLRTFDPELLFRMFTFPFVSMTLFKNRHLNIFQEPLIKIYTVITIFYFKFYTVVDY